MEQVSDTSIQNSDYEASRPGEWQKIWRLVIEKATGDMISESRKKGSRHKRKQTRRTGILPFVTSEIVSQKRGCDTRGLCSIVIDSAGCSLRHSSWLLTLVCRHGSSGVQSPLSQRTPSNMRLVARCLFVFTFCFTLVIMHPAHPSWTAFMYAPASTLSTASSVSFWPTLCMHSHSSWCSSSSETTGSGIDYLM